MTEPVHLRAPRDGDLPTLSRWRNDRDLQQLLLWRPGTFDDAAVRAWIDRRRLDPDGAFFVAAGAEEQPIGFAQLARIHRGDGHAYLGLMVDASVRGSDAANRVLTALEAYARDLGLHKLLLEVVDGNQRAIRFYDKHGYRRVGVLREHVRQNDRRCDLLLMEKILS
jgi:RimJ/RimL family protein N-acetyltransferase